MNRHRARGRPLKAAAARGSADRLRPIVSTTVTTTLGLLPLALSDPGWMPLCAAIISGELVSTVTSLVLIPCLYLVLNTEKARTAKTVSPATPASSKVEAIPSAVKV